MTAAPPRRLLAASLTLTVAVLAAAACGGNAAPGGPPTPTGSGVEGFGEGPTPPVATTTVAPPTKKPPTYPTTARAYAEAVLAAWKQSQLQRLGDLTTAQVQEQIVEIPGPPNQNWSYQECSGAAGSTYCQFFNAAGDAITLRISNSLLGKANAATDVALDQTAYPSDGEEYVKAFIQAWRVSNVARMNALAKPEVVEYVAPGPAPESPSYATVGGGGGLQQIAITNTDGFHLELHVGTTLLGSPDAIVGYAP